MSTIIMSQCWPLGGMSSAQKAVLISLADQSNDDGVCWPSVGTIAKRTCLSERAVQEALQWLQATGAVFREYKHNSSTVYTVTPGSFDAAKAPAPRSRTKGANGAPPADGAPHAPSAPPPAGGAPLEVQEAHPTPAGGAPKSSLNRNGTVNEPFPPAAQPGRAAKVDDKQAKEEAFKVLCRTTWESYSTAFVARYKTEPVRNAKVNTAITQLVKRIGAEAPEVASWFVGSVTDPFITNRCHAVGDLLANCEAYRTQWASGINPAAAVASVTQAAANRNTAAFNAIVG